MSYSLFDLMLSLNSMNFLGIETRCLLNMNYGSMLSLKSVMDLLASWSRCRQGGRGGKLQGTRRRWQVWKVNLPLTMLVILVLDEMCKQPM